MNDYNYNLKTPVFDSKIKFYFSLLFMSIDDYEVLVDNFGDNIDIFNSNVISDISFNDKLNKIFDNLKWNENKINLSDKTILKLFNNEEIVNYYDLYSSSNSNFNVDDPEELEKFYIYMLLEKVKLKKQTEYGTIYDLFDTFSDEEILNAVANLDFEDKKTFITLFGFKGDLPFEINSNNHIRNDILIKLYSYMLLKRDESDIPSIIRNIIERGDYEYTFFDYIRNLCGDKNLSNEFILEMLSKMDYNSKKYIKEVFGEKLDKKAKPSKEKPFKKAIDNLTIIVKVNKEYRERKEQIYNTNKKKKAGFEEEKEKQKNKTKEDSKEGKKQEEKEPKKETLKQENKSKDQNKKDKKEKQQKKENKKERLNKFLKEKGLDKKDFEKAVELLDELSKKVVELYYGIKTQPIELDEIARRLSKPLEDILVILDKAEKKIEELIKTGEINKEKIDKKVEEKEPKRENVKLSNKLQDFIVTGNVKESALLAAMLVLNPIEKNIVDAVLSSKSNSFDEIAINLNLKKEKVEEIFELSTDKLISKLSKNLKEEKQEVKKPEKEEVKEKVNDNKKNNKEKTSSLNDFLKETGLTKAEFFKGFAKLDAFSKTVLSLYLGLYATSFTVSEIAKKYGRSEASIENIIASAKDNIIKENNKVDKISLSEFLNKNGLTKDDFNELLKKLSPLNKNMMKDYFGIGTNALTLDAMSKRYGKSPKEINKIIESNLNQMTNEKKNKKDNSMSDKLNKFLTVNKITKDQFLTALELIAPEDKKLVSMYFGIGQREMSIAEIALLTKTNPLIIKNNLQVTLRQINSLSKSKDLNKNVLSQKYQSVKLRISKSSSMLLQDASFMTFVASNPMISNLLSVVCNTSLSLEDAAKILGMSSEKLINELMSVSIVCDDFISNMSKTANNGFQDEEVNQKEVGRRY